MTRFATPLVAAVLVLGLWTAAITAQQPRQAPSPPGPSPLPAPGDGVAMKGAPCSLPRLCGCPDDYCCKPMPSIYVLRCGMPDDYCHKPFPSAHLLWCCGGVDDYNRKPYPSLCRPLCTDYYSCGTPCRPCAQAK
jgi:hypothetical protein